MFVIEITRVETIIKEEQEWRDLGNGSMGWTPSKKIEKEMRSLVYTQSFQSMDLAKVVVGINGLNK